MGDKYKLYISLFIMIDCLMTVRVIALAILVAIIWSWLGQIDDKLDKQAEVGVGTSGRLQIQ